MFHNWKTKRRRGNLLMIVLLCGLVASLMFGVFMMAANNVLSAQERLNSTSELYTNLTLADIFADAFYTDLSVAYYNRAPVLGETTTSLSTYEECIKSISDTYLQEQADGSYLYVIQDANAVVEYLYFDGEYASPTMASSMKNAVEKINEKTFTITADKGLVPDLSNENNVLTNNNGDIYYLEDIMFELKFSVGVYQYKQTYEITGLAAEFTMLTSGIDCRINSDNAAMTLVQQTINT